MGAGNDSIFIDYLYMDGDSYLNMGDGDDILRGSLDIEEGTTVSMDSGNDTVIVEGPYEHFGLYGGSMLLMGEGDDYLDVGGGSGNYLQGYVDMGDGNDTVVGEYMYFSGSSYIDMGAGDDLFDVGVQGGINFYGGHIRLGAGDDTMYIRGNDDLQTISGGSGADRLIFTFISNDDDLPGWMAGSPEFTDFSLAENDVIDISQILSGYDPLSDAISDFVRFVDSGSDSILQVDADGGADNFVELLTIIGHTGLDALALESSGHLETVVMA